MDDVPEYIMEAARECCAGFFTGHRELYIEDVARAMAALSERERRTAQGVTWQPIETAPKDGTAIDLWGVNHLHPSKTGWRATDVAWGRVRDWMGNEREDWQHGQGEDFEPTHWHPLPAAPPFPPAQEVGNVVDIVERLNDLYSLLDNSGSTDAIEAIMAEAAAEVTRLRAEVEELRAIIAKPAIERAETRESLFPEMSSRIAAERLQARAEERERAAQIAETPPHDYGWQTKGDERRARAIASLIRQAGKDGGAG